MNIESPKTRIIEYEDSEFKEMIINLERVSIDDPYIYNKFRLNIKERNFLLLIEYVPSLLLYDFGVSRAEILLTELNFKSRSLFMNLGEILAVNIFLNNSSSIPFLWNNQGNPNKILFRMNLDNLPVNVDFKDQNNLDIYLEKAICIDIKPMCMDPSNKKDLKDLGDYLNILSTQLKEFFYEMKMLMIYGNNIEPFEFKCFTQLVEFFRNSCGIIISSYNLFHFSMGLITMLQNIINIRKESLSDLIKFVQKEAIFKDWGDIYKQNANRLLPNYFNYLLDYLKQFKEENEEIFEWVNDATADTRKVDFNLRYKEVVKSQKDLVYNILKNNREEVLIDEKKNLQKEDNREVEPNEFNFNRNDKKKFENDVRNGIYDIFDIDNDPSWVLETKKREYKKVEKEKEVQIDEIKINPIVKKKYDAENLEENIDPHKPYTMEELKDKIQKDELKETLKIKKKYNPEEYKFIENKIKGVDESFLVEDEGANKENNT
jgi:hypothetical protein